jgi:uncharacterized protein
MRIFLDANVLFSAAKSDGAVRELLSLLRARGHALFADAYVAEEARRNIALKAEDRVGALEKLLAEVSMVATGRAAIGTGKIDLPEKDLPVLDAAARGRCDVLVSGDKTHFGSLFGTSVAGVTVLSPAQVAERL